MKKRKKKKNLGVSNAEYYYTVLDSKQVKPYTNSAYRDYWQILYLIFIIACAVLGLFFGAFVGEDEVGSSIFVSTEIEPLLYALLFGLAAGTIGFFLGGLFFPAFPDLTDTRYRRVMKKLFPETAPFHTACYETDLWVANLYFRGLLDKDDKITLQSARGIIFEAGYYITEKADAYMRELNRICKKHGEPQIPIELLDKSRAAREQKKGEADLAFIMACLQDRLEPEQQVKQISWEEFQETLRSYREAEDRKENLLLDSNINYIDAAFLTYLAERYIVSAEELRLEETENADNKEVEIEDNPAEVSDTEAHGKGKYQLWHDAAQLAKEDYDENVEFEFVSLCIMVCREDKATVPPTFEEFNEFEAKYRESHGIGEEELLYSLEGEWLDPAFLNELDSYCTERQLFWIGHEDKERAEGCRDFVLSYVNEQSSGNGKIWFSATAFLYLEMKYRQTHEINGEIEIYAEGRNWVYSDFIEYIRQVSDDTAEEQQEQEYEYADSSDGTDAYTDDYDSDSNYDDGYDDDYDNDDYYDDDYNDDDYRDTYSSSWTDDDEAKDILMNDINANGIDDIVERLHEL